MNKCKNPQVFELTNTSKLRTYSLSNLRLPEGLTKLCVWCLSPLQGKLRRWCGDECVKEALVWGRPQSYHGLYALLKKQNNKCNLCNLSYEDYINGLMPQNSVYRGSNLSSRQIEVLMKRFRRAVPRSIRPEVDHILAIVLGGKALGLENHQILCASCHKEKTKKDIKEKFSKYQNPRKGVKFTPAHVDALSKARKGKDTPNRLKSREKNLYPKLRIPIVAINIVTGERLIFNSIDDASKALNLQGCNISRVLNKKQNRKQHKGWTFEYNVDTVDTKE